MSSVRIRLVTASDPISWLIRGAEMGFLFSHAEVVMPDGTYLGAHADGGVEARPPGYDAKYKPVELMIDVPCTDTQADSFHAYLKSQIGKPYDMGAIRDLAIGTALPVAGALAQAAEDPQPWLEPDAWFCSELVIAALIHAGFYPGGLPSSPRHITPRDLEFALAGIATIGKPVHASRAPAAATAQARPV